MPSRLLLPSPILPPLIFLISSLWNSSKALTANKLAEIHYTAKFWNSRLHLEFSESWNSSVLFHQEYHPREAWRLHTASTKPPQRPPMCLKKSKHLRRTGKAHHVHHHCISGNSRIVTDYCLPMFPISRSFISFTFSFFNISKSHLKLLPRL